MKKSIVISALGAAGALGVTAYYFNEQKKKSEKINQTFEDAGVPDQAEDIDLAQLENAKMVSEGSQFGVQYYNEMKESNRLENQQNG